MTVCAGEIGVGFEVPAFSRLITREMAMAHGAPLVNFHTDLAAARRMGFADLVIAGPMFVCFFSEMFTRFYGERWITGGDLDFKLVKPVLANETITARAVVTAMTPRDASVRVVMDVWCQREDDGAKTAVGTAGVLLEP